ncbi:MAG: tRNA guanosine(34) transglycosylase Tgt [Candidatus Dormibacteria bacterium]|jgi:queuine tRNA-ribosyltransferase
MSSEETFAIVARDGEARRGRLRTAHGEMQTPAFMPVGTHASVKACDPQEVAESGAEMVLCNFYHLALRPGVDLIEEMGGLHRFMGWSRSILTDSGGYQLVSLGELIELDDGGVTFRSPYDGATVRLTPQGVVEGQLRLGSDVIMVLDQPVPFGTSVELAESATRRTHHWAAQCREVDTGVALLFGIVQGGFETGLRSQSAEAIAALGFDGVALGGLVLGEPPQVRQLAIDACVRHLPDLLPRYLMGLGTDLDLLDSISRGVDLFDCVLPTRLARTGTALTSTGRISLRHARFRSDPRQLEADCDCPACSNFSRAYLRHLYLSGEILAHRMLSLHNLRHLGRLMKEARQAIESGRLRAFIESRRGQLAQGSES